MHIYIVIYLQYLHEPNGRIAKHAFCIFDVLTGLISGGSWGQEEGQNGGQGGKGGGDNTQQNAKRKCQRNTNKHCTFACIIVKIKTNCARHQRKGVAGWAGDRWPVAVGQVGVVGVWRRGRVSRQYANELGKTQCWRRR